MSTRDQELSLLRAQTATLDEQLKVLVRTEQRLFGSQRALDQQLARMRSLANLALASSPHDTMDVVVGRMRTLLTSLFRIDRIVVLESVAGREELRVWSGERTPKRVPADPVLQTWLREPAGVTVRPMTDLAHEERRSALFALAERLGMDTTPDPSGNLAALLAPGEPDALAVFAWRSTHLRSLFLAESLSPRHEPFLLLVADYLRRSVDNVRLTDALERRRRELAEANEHLNKTLTSLQETQEALLRAQKMEAIGRLAGGVAHDFNNMLTIILGSVTLARRHVEPDDPVCRELETIREAGLRSADLTRQLLAFARKQPNAPTELDLNDAVAQRRSLLDRLVGETIALFVEPATDLWPVEADPSQLDQILSNLAVNARDAGATRVVVRTSNEQVGTTEARRAENAKPGDYARLSFTDDGCGMDAATLARAFDPFFTTKADGSGLGLATVHGIVKQNGGLVEVESSPGEGTTFHIYLPRAKRPH